MWSRSRLVSTIHDLAPLALPEVFSGVHRRLAARFYFGCAKRRAHRIIAVSNFTRNEILSRGIAEPERVTAIPNGVGTYWFEGEAPAVRRPRLLFVGNLKPHKNLARLVEAVERVRTTNAVELAVAGKIEGFRTGIASDALARLRSTPWITLLGELTDQELRSQYSECSALVFPSMYEGFGLPLLEAMAGGCPVVSSKAPALAEIGGPERSEGGIVEYFDPLDCEDMARAIRRHLASSEVERRLIGEAGRRRAADYTWERTASATWDLLERACRS